MAVNRRVSSALRPWWGRASDGRVHSRDLLAAFLCLFLMAGHLSATGRAERIVSLNLAADQALLALADADQIAALTWFAADPALSPLHRRAAAFPGLRGEAEEVILLKPDVVFVGRFSAPNTTRFLRRAGLELVEVTDPANSFGEIEENLRTVGGAIGHPERAEAHILRLRAELARVRALPPPGRALRILPYEFNNWIPGRGVLLHALIIEAGHLAVSDELGVEGYGQAPLERVLLARPDVVLSPGREGRAPALAGLLFTHPVWARVGAPDLVPLEEGEGLEPGFVEAAQLAALRRLGSGGGR